MLDRYLDLVLGNRRLIVILVTICVLLLGSRAGGLVVSHDLQVFFSQDSDYLETFDELADEYGAEDSIYVLLIADGVGVFEPGILNLVRAVSDLAEQIPYAGNVSSITRNPLYPQVGSLLERFDSGDTTGDEAVRSLVSELRETMLQDRLLVRRLIAPDASATIVRVELLLPDDSESPKQEVMKFARAMVERYSAEHPEVRFLLGGTVAISIDMIDAVTADVKAVTPLALLLILAALFVFTRSVGATIAIVMIMTFSVIMAMGLFGWLGMELSPLSGFIPTAIITIAVADSVHLLIGYQQELFAGRDKLDSIRTSIHLNLKPVFFTSLTSIIGMLSLNFSDSPPYRELGNMIATGIFFAYCMSMLLWPAFMAWLPTPTRRADGLTGRLMASLGEFVVRRYRLIITIAFAVTIMLATQIGKNVLTERWYEYLDRSHQSRIVIDEMSDRFGGIHHVFYSLESGRPFGIHKPAYIDDVDAFAEWYRQQPGVNYVVSVVDYLDYREKLRKLPSAVVKVSGQGESGRILSDDFSATRFEVVFEKSDSARLLLVDEPAQAWIGQRQPVFETRGAIGIDLIFAKINDLNIRSILKGAAIALLLVSLMLILLLKSWPLGLLSLIPNLIPISMAYGLWGLLVGEISLAVSVVMCISLGLVVDDSVHFLCKYSHWKKSMNASTEAAIRYSFRTVGVAMVITSLVLVMGFASTTMSQMLPTRETAILLTMTIFFALLGDLLILAPLLLLLDRKKQSRSM